MANCAEVMKKSYCIGPTEVGKVGLPILGPNSKVALSMVFLHFLCWTLRSS